MNYHEQIVYNCANNSKEKWWPRFAFHYTDLSNAISILMEGKIYSRFEATEKNLMKNDNASSQVIDMTGFHTKSLVRFYFRPLTPTQYYNEGFKPISIRYQHDKDANVPVPVFFVMDLEKILQMPSAHFSQYSLAGSDGEQMMGEKAFCNLDFKNIYKSGPMSEPEKEKKMRQAEITVQDFLNIDDCLKAVLCRNDIERRTLINILRAKDPRIYNLYKEKIRVYSESFTRNGLYIENCNYNDGELTIVYADSSQKDKYLYRYQKMFDDALIVNARAELKWYKSNELLKVNRIDYLINYRNPATTVFSNLSVPSQANRMTVTICFEDKKMAFLLFDLNRFALI